jgi:hypothetical protein
MSFGNSYQTLYPNSVISNLPRFDFEKELTSLAGPNMTNSLANNAAVASFIEQFNTDIPNINDPLLVASTTFNDPNTFTTSIADFTASAPITPDWITTLDKSGLNPAQVEGGFVDPNDRVGEPSFIQEFGEWGSQFINDLLGTDQKSQDEAGASGMYELDWVDKYILGKEEFGNYDVSGFKAEDIGDGLQLKSGEGNKARPTVLDDGTPIFIDDNSVMHLRSLLDASTASEAGMTAPPWFFSYDDKGDISGLDDPYGWLQNEVDEFFDPQALKEFGIKTLGNRGSNFIKSLLISGENVLPTDPVYQTAQEWRDNMVMKTAEFDLSIHPHQRSGDGSIIEGQPWKEEGWSYFDADSATRMRADNDGYEPTDADFNKLEIDLNKSHREWETKYGKEGENFWEIEGIDIKGLQNKMNKEGAPLSEFFGSDASSYDSFMDNINNKTDASLLDLNTWNDSLVLQNATMDNWMGETDGVAGVGRSWFTRAANVSGKDEALGLIDEASGWDKAFADFIDIGEAPDIRGISELNAISGLMGLDSYDPNLEAQQFRQDDFNTIMDQYGQSMESLDDVAKGKKWQDVIDPYNTTMHEWGSAEGTGGKFYNEATTLADMADPSEDDYSRASKLLEDTGGWQKIYSDFDNAFNTDFRTAWIEDSTKYNRDPHDLSELKSVRGDLDLYDNTYYLDQLKQMYQSRNKLHNMLGKKQHGFEGYYEGFDGAGEWVGRDALSQFRRGMENTGFYSDEEINAAVNNVFYSGRDPSLPTLKLLDLNPQPKEPVKVKEFTGEHNQSLNEWGDQVDNYHGRVMNITDINDPSIDGLIAEWQQAYDRTKSYKDFETKPEHDFNYEKYNNLTSRMRAARAKLEDLKNGKYYKQWGDGNYTIKPEHYENKIFGHEWYHD